MIGSSAMTRRASPRWRPLGVVEISFGHRQRAGEPPGNLGWNAGKKRSQPAMGTTEIGCSKD